MARFKIEPAFISYNKFAKIVPLQSLWHWQKLTRFCESGVLQFARHPVCEPSDMKVFRASELCKRFNTIVYETPKTSPSE
jgi:hypothetical protein